MEIPPVLLARLETLKAPFRRLPGRGGGRDALDNSRAAHQSRRAVLRQLDRVHELTIDAAEALDWAALRPEGSEAEADAPLRELATATMELFSGPESMAQEEAEKPENTKH